MRLRPLAFAVAVTVAGCSRGELTPAAAEPGLPVAALSAPTQPPTPPTPVAPVAPPTPYRPPTDLGGKAVAALTATRPPAPVALPTVTKPVPRVSEFDRGELPATALKPTARTTPLTPGKPPSEVWGVAQFVVVNQQFQKMLFGNRHSRLRRTGNLLFDCLCFKFRFELNGFP